VRYQLYVENSGKPTNFILDDVFVINAKTGVLQFVRDGHPLLCGLAGMANGVSTIQLKYQFGDMALTDEEVTLIAVFIATLTWFDVEPVKAHGTHEHAFRFIPGNTNRIGVKVNDVVEIDLIHGSVSLVKDGCLYKRGSSCTVTETLIAFHSLDYDEIHGIAQLISLLTNAELVNPVPEKEASAIIRFRRLVHQDLYKDQRGAKKKEPYAIQEEDRHFPGVRRIRPSNTSVVPYRSSGIYHLEPRNARRLMQTLLSAAE
jgi:hypothetical protein